MAFHYCDMSTTYVKTVAVLRMSMMEHMSKRVMHLKDSCSVALNWYGAVYGPSNCRTALIHHAVLE